MATRTRSTSSSSQSSDSAADAPARKGAPEAFLAPEKRVAEVRDIQIGVHEDTVTNVPSDIDGEVLAQDEKGNDVRVAFHAVGGELLLTPEKGGTLVFNREAALQLQRQVVKAGASL